MFKINNRIILILIFNFVCAMIIYGQEQQMAQSGIKDHIGLVDAGYKYDHIWISLRNFRIQKDINKDVVYAIYTNSPMPIIGPTRLDDKYMGRYPLIEIIIGIEEFGIKFLKEYKKQSDSLYVQEKVIFTLFISDSNTPEDGNFLKETLGFIITPGIWSARRQSNITQELIKIPLCFAFEDKIVIPITERTKTKTDVGYRVKNFIDFSIDKDVFDIMMKLDSIRTKLSESDRYEITSIAKDYGENQISVQHFKQKLRQILNNINKGD